MKKLVSLLLAFAMCFSLTACGGANKQPAIDAHNKAVDAVNELAEFINQDLDSYAEYVDLMNEVVETLDEAADILESDDDVNQDELDEWIEACKEIEQWAIDAKSELEN